MATFAIPSHKQLMRLDAELEDLVTAPSSFRLDARGRFAAVVWSDRVVCVYDIYTLLMLHMLQKPLNTNSRSGGASSSRNEVVNVIQLSIFGAFPCRALPSPGGVEYSFGPVAFHPTAQVLYLSASVVLFYPASVIVTMCFLYLVVGAAGDSAASPPGASRRAR